MVDEQPRVGNFENGNPGWFSEKAWEALKPWWDDIGSDFWMSGPAHIVFADPNTEDYFLDRCLERCVDIDSWLEDDWGSRGFVEQELSKIKSALLALKDVPEGEREVPYGISL